MTTAEKIEPRKRTLSEIVNDYRRVLHGIDEAEGELTVSLEEELDRAESSLADKVEKCLWVSKEAAAQAAVLKERAKGLEDRSRALKAQEERLKDYVLGSLVSLGLEKIETPHFIATVGQTPWAVSIEDDTTFVSVHAETNFVRTKLEPAKTAIKASLSDGIEVKGAQLTRRLMLRIR